MAWERVGSKALDATKSWGRTVRVLLIVAAIAAAVVLVLNQWLHTRPTPVPAVEQHGRNNQGAGINQGTMNQNGNR